MDTQNLQPQDALEMRVGALEALVEQLRGEIRRWKRFSIFTFIAFALFAGRIEVFHEAQEFTLQDEQGEVRAMLHMIPSGPALTFFDERGMPRAQLGVTAPEGPYLSLLDERGTPRVQLGVLASKGPYLSLLDERGNMRAFLYVSSLVGSHLSFYDAFGRIIWTAP